MMSPFKVTLKIFIVAVLSINLANAKDINLLYEEALGAFHKKDYGKSVVLLKEAMFENPKHLSGRILLGRSLLFSRQFPGAEDQFRQAIIDGADKSQIVIPLGQALLYQGKFDALLNVVQLNQQNSVNRTEILVLRGRAYLELNKFALARDSYDSAIQFSPSDPAGYIGNAIIELKQGNNSQSDIWLNKALKLDANNAAALQLKGDVLFQQGEFSSAKQHLKQSLSLDQNNFRTRLLLAEIYINDSDLDKALEHITFVLEFAPNSPNVNLLYAFVLLKQNKKVAALKISKNLSSYLGKIDEGDLNKHPSIRLILGTSLYLQESWENAYGHLNFYAQKYPGHEQSHLMVAELDMRFERYDAALKILEHYNGETKSIEYWLFKVGGLTKLNEYLLALVQVEQALNIYKNDPRLLEYKVKLLIATNNLPDALSLLEQLYQQGNTSDQLTLLLGQLQLNATQLVYADTVVNELLEKEASNPVYLSLSAGVDLQAGRLESAEIKLKRAIKLSPEMLQFSINLHYVYLRQGKIDLAVKILNEAYKSKPSSAFLLEKLASLAESVHNYSVAIVWRQKLVEILPDDMDNIILLSDNLIKLNRGQEAINLLLPERTNNRLNIQYLSKLSSAYISIKRCDKAGPVLDIERGLSLDNAAQLASTAHMYMKCGFNELAHKSLTSAERLDQSNIHVQLARAQWFLNINQAKLALKLIKPSADDNNMTALTLQINAYKKLNWRKTVIKLSKELYKKYPYPVHAYRLFEVLKNNGKLVEAVDLLEEYLQQRENENIRRTLAIEYLSSGDELKAESHFLVLAEQFQDAMAYRQLAILTSKKSVEQAVIFAQKSYEIDDSSPVIVATYGWLLVQNGRPKAGLPYLRFAHARDSRQPTLIYRLAETLIQLNQHEQAKLLLKQAVKYDFPDKDKAVTRLKSL